MISVGPHVNFIVNGVLQTLGEQIGALWGAYQEAGATHASQLTAESLTAAQDAETAYYRALAPLLLPAPVQGFPMELAPRDGRTLRLLVDYSGDDAGGPLEDASVAWTIGHSSHDSTGEDQWELAGWCWTHDHYTEGRGRVLAWLPFHSETRDTPTDAAMVSALRRLLRLFLHPADDLVDPLCGATLTADGERLRPEAIEAAENARRVLKKYARD